MVKQCLETVVKCFRRTEFNDDEELIEGHEDNTGLAEVISCLPLDTEKPSDHIEYVATKSLAEDMGYVHGHRSKDIITACTRLFTENKESTVIWQGLSVSLLCSIASNNLIHSFFGKSFTYTSVVQLAARGPHSAGDHLKSGPKIFVICFMTVDF
jgi:hypothetical protein